VNFGQASHHDSLRSIRQYVIRNAAASGRGGVMKMMPTNGRTGPALSADLVPITLAKWATFVMNGPASTVDISTLATSSHT
jgi:hypothetical protein